MKKLKIVFTKSKKNFAIFSLLIRIWTSRSFSHVALEVETSFLEKPMYWQASEGKVNYEYKEHFDSKHEIVVSKEIEVTKEIYYNMVKYRLMAAGEVYGTMQNLGIFLLDLASLVGIKLNNPWKKGRNCSELLYVHVLKPMYPELEYDPDTIKPSDILKILEEKGL